MSTRVFALNRVVQILPRAVQAFEQAHLKAIGLGLVAAQPRAVESDPGLVDFDQFTDVVVTSPLAAEYLSKALDSRWPQWPVGIRFWAVGSATAQVLPSDQTVETASPAGSAALITKMQHALDAHARILIACQAGGGHQFEVLATERNTLDYWTLYDLQPLATPDVSSLDSATHLVHGSAALLNAWLKLPQSVHRQAEGCIHCVTSESAELLLTPGTRYHRIETPAPHHVQSAIQGEPRVKGI